MTYIYDICLYDDCPHDTSIPQHKNRLRRVPGVAASAAARSNHWEASGRPQRAGRGGAWAWRLLGIQGIFGWGFYGDLIGVNKMLMGFNDDSMGFS